MKTLSILFVLLLTGCDGIIDLIDASISRTAKQTFIVASGNAIEIKEANAIAPVRVPVTVERLPNGQPTGAIYFSVGTQCTQSWNVSVVGNYDPFWLGNGEAGTPTAWYVTYDAAENQCVRRRCGGAYVAGMDTVVPQLAVVTIGCDIF